MIEHVDVIRLNYEHALISSHLPINKKIGLTEYENKVAKDIEAGIAPTIESYGLFDKATPNYANYYPDVKPEDFKPSEEDFITPLVRALSEVIVHKDSNPVSFAKPGVLKNSMSLLVGQSVLVDHERAIGNTIGAITNAAWQKGYTTSLGGIQIPAGINTLLKIDGKSNPRLVRGMTMDPPSIHSVSVTVEFNWEQSHPELALDEFYRRLGTYDDKGDMIHRVATKVRRYHEISLVAHGADPYAQLINPNGEITNPMFANVTYNSANKTVENHIFCFSYKSDTLSNSTDGGTSILKNSKHNQQTSQSSNMKQIALLLGLSENIQLSDLKPENIVALEAKITALQSEALTAEQKTSLAELPGLKTKVTELTNANTQLTTEKGTLTTQLGDIKNAKVTEVTRLYELAMGDKKSQTTIDAIKNADFTALASYQELYNTQVESAMPLTCTECNSVKVSRRASKANDPEGSGAAGKTSLTLEELHAKHTKPDVTRLHGKEEKEKA